MIKVIIFDWDGTIVDSVRLKYEAWFELFTESEAKDAIKRLGSDAIRKNSRYEILRMVFRELKNSPHGIEEFVSCYASEYNRKVQEGIIQKGFMSGALDMLDNLKNRYHLYVNSATPEEALRETVRNVGTAHFFQGVYGRSPDQDTFTQVQMKVENLNMIFEKEEVTSKEVVVVGDGEDDYESASECDCRFVGIGNEINKWMLVHSRFPVVNSLSRLEEIIK